LLCLAALCAAEDPLIKPGLRLAVIDTAHIHALVPKDQAKALRALVARAEVLYVALAKEAGYTIRRRLNLIISDDFDSHNGYSFVTPFPLIQVELAPPLPESGIFDGLDHVERTLVHELTHHISNDRSHGFRRALEIVFGRVLPFDPLSLLTAYLSTPAHQTMPSFWQEGLAQWAETHYAPAGVWGGRGRDSLTHMIWRLDAAADAIPQVGDWRLSYQQWPFGNRAYVYGLAYLRYLDGAYADKASIWKLLDAQARQWAFAFTGGSEELIGKNHARLIGEARKELLREQKENIAKLSAKPLTALQRLTPADTTVAAPAWMPDGRLIAAINSPYDFPAFSMISRNGSVKQTRRSAFAMSAARSLPDGTLVYSETPSGNYPWSRNRIYITTSTNHLLPLPAKRLIQPDVRLLWPMERIGERLQVAAVRLREAGRHDLVTGRVDVRDQLFGQRVESILWIPIPTEGRPWNPVFRPMTKPRSDGEYDGELTWIETDAKGSRIVLAPLADPLHRTILAQVAGRILHPVWNRNGTLLYACCDHTGVSNAYVLDPTKPGVLAPITNTLGGVTACVPSPDGKDLALVAYDRKGPFIAIIPNDPAAYPPEIASIPLAWPAPIPGKERPAHEPLPTTPGRADMKTKSYHGLSQIRPLFWTPTTLPVPDGGFGALGVAADPILSHVAVASAGVGPVEAEPIGMFGYAYTGWPVDFALIGMQSERTYNDQIVDTAGDEYDYSERIANGEFRIGTGLAGFRRQFQTYVAAGISDHRVVDDSDDEYQGSTLLNTPAFRGVEQYLEATIAYNDALFFPTSYAPENGNIFSVTYRASDSDISGELTRNRLLARAATVISVWPQGGHQVVLGGELGWSEGDQTLQGAFAVGGALGLTLPRGYVETQATGADLLAGSFAYRFPVWRHFKSFGSSPWVHRQVVVEAFIDGAKVSSDHIGGDGEWFRSIGGEVHDSWEFWYLLLQPGIGVARQLDGDEDTVAYFSIDFRL
jgi:hypothetical protein